MPCIQDTSVWRCIQQSWPGDEEKQLLMCAFLGQANMLDELFGHALAVSPNKQNVSPQYRVATGPFRLYTSS